MGTKLAINEITNLISNFKYILVNSFNEYWVSGTDYSDIEYSNDISDAHIFNTSADAATQRLEIDYNRPDVNMIDDNLNGFYYIEDCRKYIATEFSSYSHANTIVYKMYEGGRNEYYGDSPDIYNNSFNYYTTKFASVTTTNYTTSSQNLVDIPVTRWQSLNYFFTPV
jgi:hypothetical protein